MTWFEGSWGYDPDTLLIAAGATDKDGNWGSIRFENDLYGGFERINIPICVKRIAFSYTWRMRAQKDLLVKCKQDSNYFPFSATALFSYNTFAIEFKYHDEATLNIAMDGDFKMTPLGPK